MKKRYQRWILAAAWAVVIFLFSCQNGASSGNNNHIIMELFNRLGIDLNVLFNGHGDFIIRKAAHVTEFFILYYFLFNAMSLDLSFKKSAVAVLCIVFLYACSDEIHQIFVQGRGPSFRDVMIDTGGGTLCMLVKIIKYSIKRKTEAVS